MARLVGRKVVYVPLASLFAGKFPVICNVNAAAELVHAVNCMRVHGPRLGPPGHEEPWLLLGYGVFLAACACMSG